MSKLDKTFYIQDDVVKIAKNLIGKVLFTKIEGKITAGIILETEAYHENEKACHAYNKRRTKRTELLFNEGGSAYVYLCYGIHHLFNVVTGPKESAQAVLIRGIFPFEGIDFMLERRNMTIIKPNISAGPGTLSQALGITTALDGISLSENTIWIEDLGFEIADKTLEIGPRIGIDYAEEDAALPWRFYVETKHIKSLIF